MWNQEIKKEEDVPWTWLAWELGRHQLLLDGQQLHQKGKETSHEWIIKTS